MSEADRTFGFMLDTGEEQLMDIGEVKTYNQKQVTCDMDTVYFVKIKKINVNFKFSCLRRSNMKNFMLGCFPKQQKYIS